MSQQPSALNAPVGQLGRFEMFDYPDGRSRPAWISEPAIPAVSGAEPSERERWNAENPGEMCLHAFDDERPSGAELPALTDAQILDAADAEFPNWRYDIQEQFVLRVVRAAILAASSRSTGAGPARPATQADVDAFTASLRRRSNPWAYGCADLIDKLWLATQAPKASPAVSGAEPPVAWVSSIALALLSSGPLVPVDAYLSPDKTGSFNRPLYAAPVAQQASPAVSGAEPICRTYAQCMNREKPCGAELCDKDAERPSGVELPAAAPVLTDGQILQIAAESLSYEVRDVLDCDEAIAFARAILAASSRSTAV